MQEGARAHGGGPEVTRSQRQRGLSEVEENGRSTSPDPTAKGDCLQFPGQTLGPSRGCATCEPYAAGDQWVLRSQPLPPRHLNRPWHRD